MKLFSFDKQPLIKQVTTLGTFSSIFLTIMIARLIWLIIFGYVEPEFAGWELIILIPCALAPLLGELPILIYLLIKRSKQIPVRLLICQFILLLIFGSIELLLKVHFFAIGY